MMIKVFMTAFLNLKKRRRVYPKGVALEDPHQDQLDLIDMI